MKDCCHKKLMLAQEKITELMDDSMPDDFLIGLEVAIDEIDEIIFKSIAKEGKIIK